jgi:hypothetical protein
MAVFELCVWIMQATLRQTRIPNKQESSQMPCRPFHLPSYQSSSSGIFVSNLTTDGFTAAL